jgi:anti-anti-sigma factor
LDIDSEVTNGVAVYRIAGRIDEVARPQLESAVDSAINGGTPRILLDMRAVTYISSAGLRGILSTAKRAIAAKGGLAIFGLRSAVNEVFQIAGIQNFLPIASDEIEARSRLGV